MNQNKMLIIMPNVTKYICVCVLIRTTWVYCTCLIRITFKYSEFCYHLKPTDFEKVNKRIVFDVHNIGHHHLNALLPVL